MTRVANLAQFDRTLSRISDTQLLWNRLQMQIASGRKSEDYAGLGRNAERLVSLQSTHGRVSQYTDNNKIVDTRLQTMESSIGQVFDILSRYKTLLVNALNSDNGVSLGLAAQSQQMLNEVSALLNVRDGNRYLFAGSKTDTLPVDLSGLPIAYAIPTTAGGSIGYYQGDSVALKVQADDNLQVTYGVTAGDSAIEAGIRALHLGVTQGPTDRVALNHALDVVNALRDDRVTNEPSTEALLANAPATDVPENPDQAYDAAFNALKVGKYDDAIAQFNNFLVSYPDSARADSAQYWLGEAYYVNKQYDPAIMEYQKLVNAYPTSQKVSQAMLKIGFCQNELGQLEQARATLEEVKQRFPGTTSARMAEDRLQRMRLEQNP